ncbi:MAG: TIGR02996 domain-containing protein [Planctomycetes bacterium]|nr:TIGR02996 domain-containing protein [Planctomycetota bacterium]
MKHPDWPAFLAAIVAEPDDDTRRLVAADFLEEHGEPDRAAFIRVQVELARLEGSELGRSAAAVELRKKERAFLGPKAVYSHLWAAEECPELVRADPRGRLHFEGADRLTWRRGFVDEVRCPAAEWLRHGAAVRARNPVCSVVLRECERLSRDAWYAGLDALRGLRAIDLELDRTDDPSATAVPELAAWLGRWLPGTEVVWLPF